MANYDPEICVPVWIDQFKNTPPNAIAQAARRWIQQGNTNPPSIADLNSILKPNLRAERAPARRLLSESTLDQQQRKKVVLRSAQKLKDLGINLNDLISSQEPD